MKTLVIGLGNPILTDDGVGIYAARMVREALPTDTEVDVIEVSVGGLTLMEAMVGYDKVILIDALWMPGGQVGEVIQFDAGDLPDTLNTASAHDVDLPTALQVGQRLGAPLPDLEHIQIVAVQIQDVLTFGESPTPPVVAAIPEAVAQVMALLGYHHEGAFPPGHVFLSGGYDDFS